MFRLVEEPPGQIGSVANATVGIDGLAQGGEAQTSKVQSSIEPPSWLTLSVTVSVQVPAGSSPLKADNGESG